MEKKKLKKLQINKMSGFPIISEQEQMMMKGGYTFDEMEQMINNGTWEGGQVDGLGYVSAAIEVSASYLDGVRDYIYYNYDGGVRADSWKDGSNAAKIGWFLGRWVSGA